MTTARDFGAPRNASFWQQNVVSLHCDGAPSPAEPCPANRIPLRAPTAADAREHANELGWRVNVAGQPGRRHDYCPEHREQGNAARSRA
jgi:hypothetical protein